MFGLGTMEIVVIMVVALLVLGPQKLPGIARTLGRTLGEFRRVSSEFQRTLNEEVEREERKKAASPASSNPSAGETVRASHPAPTEQAQPATHGAETSPLQAAADGARKSDTTSL